MKRDRINSALRGKGIKRRAQIIFEMQRDEQKAQGSESGLANDIDGDRDSSCQL